MRTGLYSIGELFDNRHIEQLIVPEIQRDYVWESKQVEALLKSILANFAAWHREKDKPRWSVVPAPDEKDPSLQSIQEDFAAFHARRTRATNVGFVYAYCDADLPGQYFLIDGQQRLTTLYLALLALASLNPLLKERFRARYGLQSAEPQRLNTAAPTKLDYKVREHTAQFLRQFVHYFLEDGALEQLADQVWYLERFSHDRTAANLARNFAKIQTVLKPALPALLANETSLLLYEYFEDLVQCWYFDTNESAQGEELYLYLNARGESIADNENLKARLLSALTGAAEKDTWGRKWEEWQDYFWKHRRTGLSGKEANPNADRGFNSFLSCVAHLEKPRGASGMVALEISLETIETYLKILCWLEKDKESFKKAYSYAGWIVTWFDEVWNTFNRMSLIDWSVSLSDSKKSAEHNCMVLVWGSLLCVKCALERKQGNWEELDVTQVFRAIRIVYLRYQNFDRAVASLPKTVEGLLNADSSVLGGDEDAGEERAKWNFLTSFKEEERQKVESVIWEIEDHPLNLKGGRGLGGVNLTHLVDLTSAPPPTLEQLKKVRDKFYELFPPSEGSASDNKKRIALVLLYYGPFWHRVNPWYYENYELGEWGRTIRGKGSEEKKCAEGTVFWRFFNKFPGRQALEDFATSKKGSESIDPSTEEDLRKALIWYAEKYGIRLLDKGMHVARTFEECDAQFPKLNVLWNTKGDFRGYGNTKLGALIEKPSPSVEDCS